MLYEMKNLISQVQITKNELLEVLKEEAKKVDISDFIQCNLQIRKNTECIHTSYRKDCIKSYTDFVLHIRDVKADNTHYTGQIDADKLNDAVNLLLNQEKEKDHDLTMCTWRIYIVISLYSTFIKEEPIHQVGFKFPGGLTVNIEGDKFTCPVKENNKDNTSAVCPFCIAEQDESV